ncbi:MAG TPA: DUF3658 domain-containing protein [Chitinophaga sp.]|uniref:DUF3658 domain-containing protein n=1 Tax=Chitinophaga sp. TaxID=1869181 RepID=UPI002C441E70|nr:DUF3658 domain-containing protein [Chitinophaga sp.]HVI45720.1 DUF3658 domain-containing protein [Chitinophaga sp.]
MTDLHVTSSLSGAGTLRWAISKNMLEGETFCINDIPGTGPLNDGVKRMKFLKGLSFSKEGVNWAEDTDAFEPWHRLLTQLREQPVKRLLLWAGSDGNDYVFIRMACYWLQHTAVNVMLVQVPPNHGYGALPVNRAEELAPMISQAVMLNDTARNELAQEYERIVARPELLRECDENGILQFLDLSAHDDLLLQSCSRSWKTAARVIGNAMGLCDPRNGLGDAFLSSRLEHLIVSGRIKADAPRTSMGAFRVKLAG